jgi:inosine triphosphate pyrophosphatase
MTKASKHLNRRLTRSFVFVIFYTNSWRVLDVTVAMAYGMLSAYGKANRSVSAAAAVLRGFNSVYPLYDLERKNLVLLMACRLACSATLGAYSYQQNPANKYLLLHSEPCWQALELIWCHDQTQREEMTRALNRVFDQACLYTDSRETIIACHDLVLPDPSTADLLYTVRVPFDYSIDSPQKKKQKLGEKDAAPPTITFVTGNAKKLEEVKRILGMNGSGGNESSTKLPFHLTNSKIDLPELQGDPIEVATQKCKAAAEKVGGAVIIEDTSLCFNALNGMPGVYIKWFLDSCGLEGLNKMLSGFEDKTAFAQTVVAFCPGPGKEIAVFDGRTDGKITEARGDLAFGWDPIFEPKEGEGKTYAEMTKAGKDAISHRSRAFGKLRAYLVKFRSDVLSQIE